MPIIQCDDATLYYEDYGDGDPIVFLHELTAGLQYFEPQLTGLEGVRRVAFDFRGHGRSEKTDQGHTLAQYARDLAFVLDSLALDDVVLVSLSTGALVAWEYVAQYGTDRLRALVTIDMEPAPTSHDGSEHGRFELETLREVSAAAQAKPEIAPEEDFERSLLHPPSRDQMAMMKGEARTPPLVKSALCLELACDYRAVLPEIDVPALVCASRAEHLACSETVDAVAEAMPDARVVEFMGSWTCPPLEEPGPFNRELAEFVAALETS